MQDRYASDVGDFGKLGMLRKIAYSGLKIGINWYLTYKPEEHIKDDGKHLRYLNDIAFKGCDDGLRDSLGMIIRGERNVSSLEKADWLMNTTYYSDILKPGSDRSFNRLKWHYNSLGILSCADVIFCDPDNGLIVKSVSERSKKSDKYILPEEITSYFQAGKSVIFYNHRCREKEDIYLKRFHSLRRLDELSDAVWKGLKSYVFTVEPFNGKLMGVAECRVHGELTAEEFDLFKESIICRAADGFSEGFEQRPIKTSAGEIYVSLWNGGSSWSK